MIIDGTNLLMGRLASFVAKKALLGEKIDIVNCEKVMISGNRESVFAKYRRFREMGEPFHGPFMPRVPHLILKRTIRGMLPYKQEKGKKAFQSIMCHIGVPKELEGKKFETIKEANILKLPNLKKTSLKEVSEWLGVKKK